MQFSFGKLNSYGANTWLRRRNIPNLVSKSDGVLTLLRLQGQQGRLETLN